MRLVLKTQLHEDVTQMSMVPTPATLFSLQACTYSLIGGVGRQGSHYQLTEEEKTQAWFTDGSA